MIDRLGFISEAELTELVQNVVVKISAAVDKGEKDPHKNVVDPFSSVFESIYFQTNMSEWLEKEKARQIQKSFQNAIGDFHQRVLGRVEGWQDLRVGSVADLVNHEMKIIAEIKNKHNTTKGSDKVRIYDGLAALLGRKEYRGYTAYYVEVIPKTPKRINKPFTPSDNTTKAQRVANESIRLVDGAMFYEVATGRRDALRELYAVLPSYVGLCCQQTSLTAEADPEFMNLFDKAFGVDNK
ncbi:Eco47II family restriction endonuclease [Candidatus Uhrbacteria bacterium]|nr:Eco47II family restriction endonuclease [Candidatus Uhrbacteria bacterium]